MKQCRVTNIPDSVFERLEDRAAKNRRCLNTEILCLLEQALQAEELERYDTREMLAEARKIRMLFA
ncbi:MAG: Arc family DNA-binding protein [Candidatus Hydrogenedentes bacterium]|nr:Arc family DNA-binding protein [Candidatus Hydrogenedentota bacterium]MBI3119887.1 Arc family DNA-binding protein [Candidatus Hydrogenedentota bacterium]